LAHTWLMFCLDWGVKSWGCGRLGVWGFEKKVEGVFGLGYVRIDVWWKLIEGCEWWDDFKDILNYF